MRNPGISSSHTKTAPATHLRHQQQTHRATATNPKPPPALPSVSILQAETVSQGLLLLSAPRAHGLSQRPQPPCPRSSTVHHPGLDKTTHTPSN